MSESNTIPPRVPRYRYRITYENKDLEAVATTREALLVLGAQLEKLEHTFLALVREDHPVQRVG